MKLLSANNAIILHTHTFLPLLWSSLLNFFHTQNAQKFSHCWFEMRIIGIADWYEAEDAVNGDAGETVVAESVDADENGAADVDNAAKVADAMLVGNVELLTTESRNDNV